MTGWAVGEHVMGRAPRSLAEFVCANSHTLMRIPESVSWEEAGGFPNTFVTAHDALVTAAKVGPGDTVLVNAASSGIGVAAIQIASLFGASTVIATSRSAPRSSPRWLSFGSRRRSRFCTTTRSMTQCSQRPTADDIIIDSLGGACLEQNVKVLALDGRLISVGRTASPTGELDLDHLSRRGHRQHHRCHVSDTYTRAGAAMQRAMRRRPTRRAGSGRHQGDHRLDVLARRHRCRAPAHAHRQPPRQDRRHLLTMGNPNRHVTESSWVGRPLADWPPQLVAECRPGRWRSLSNAPERLRNACPSSPGIRGVGQTGSHCGRRVRARPGRSRTRHSLDRFEMRWKVPLRTPCSARTRCWCEL